MPVTPVPVPALAEPSSGFAQVTSATGGRIIHLSGQVAQDATGALVEGGLAEQAAQAFINVKTCVEAAGATVDDIAHVRIYIKDWDPSMLEAFGRGAAAAQAAGVVLPASSVTMVGVTSLFTPEMLIEVEAVAVVD